jgi:hypothetical protein
MKTTPIESTQVEKAGAQLACKHCGHDEFLVHDVKLNSAWMQFIDDDWLSEFAEVNICAQCGYLHWFTQLKTKVEQYRKNCPGCQQLILSTRSYCPHCDYDLDPMQEETAEELAESTEAPQD